MTYQQRLVEMAKELLEAGEFYHSAIELTGGWEGSDFENYEKRLKALVAEIEASES